MIFKLNEALLPRIGGGEQWISNHVCEMTGVLADSVVQDAPLSGRTRRSIRTDCLYSVY